MNTFVLYFIISIANSSGTPTAVTSGSQVHNSQVACEEAKHTMRESLAGNAKTVSMFCARQ